MLLLSWRCAGWGFFLEKDFFGKLDRCTIFILFVEFFLKARVPSGSMHILFVLKKNFLESPGRGSVFFLLKNMQQLTSGRAASKKNFLESPVPSGSMHNFFGFEVDFFGKPRSRVMRGLFSFKIISST